MRDWLEKETNGNKDELRHIYERIDTEWLRFTGGKDKNPIPYIRNVVGHILLLHGHVS